MESESLLCKHFFEFFGCIIFGSILVDFAGRRWGSIIFLLLRLRYRCWYLFGRGRSRSRVNLNSGLWGLWGIDRNRYIASLILTTFSFALSFSLRFWIASRFSLSSHLVHLHEFLFGFSICLVLDAKEGVSHRANLSLRFGLGGGICFRASLCLCFGLRALEVNKLVQSLRHCRNLALHRSKRWPDLRQEIWCLRGNGSNWLGSLLGYLSSCLWSRCLGSLLRRCQF